MTAVVACLPAVPALALTEQAISLHNAGAMHATSLAAASAPSQELEKPVLEATHIADKMVVVGIQDLSQSPPGLLYDLADEDDDRASSVLSSVASSDLSSLSSDEDEADIKPARKRRRKNLSTPGTSIDDDIFKKSTSSRSKHISFKPSSSWDHDVVDRKEYLQAGLYSGATNGTSSSSSSSASVAGRLKPQRKVVDAKGRIQLSRTLDEIVETFKFGLPLFHGESLLEQNRTFRLPWDILSDFDLSRLPETPEDLRYRSEALDRVGMQMKPTSYKNISQNRLTWRAKDEAERLAICDCPVGECGDSCLNRIMQFFCSPKLCKSGKECKNLPFSMKPSPKHDLQVFWTGNRGFGLRTNTHIAAGDFVMQYVGEIITINESYRRTVEDYKDRHDYYFLHYYDAEVVDAGHMGNESRFVNHSCDPNLHVVRWKLADYDEYQIGLFAMRDIKPKEELSYDYGWQAFSSIDSKDIKEGGDSAKGEVEKQRCLCAAASCTGFLEKAEKAKEKKVALLDKSQRKQKTGLKRSHSSNSSKIKKA